MKKNVFCKLINCHFHEENFLDHAHCFVQCFNTKFGTTCGCVYLTKKGKINMDNMELLNDLGPSNIMYRHPLILVAALLKSKQKQ